MISVCNLRTDMVTTYLLIQIELIFFYYISCWLKALLKTALPHSTKIPFSLIFPHLTPSDLLDLTQPSIIWPQLTNPTENSGVAQLSPSLFLAQSARNLPTFLGKFGLFFLKMAFRSYFSIRGEGGLHKFVRIHTHTVWNQERHMAGLSQQYNIQYILTAWSILGLVKILIWSDAEQIRNT